MTKKIFKPFCLSLGFLMAASPLVSKEAIKPQNMLEKYEKERVKLIEEFAHSPISPASTYSDKEYGPLAAPLNKLRQLLESSKQETIAGVQAFKEVDLENIPDDVFFDLIKIVDKKKKLERLSTFLDESEKRAEKAYSDYKTWLTSSPELDEFLRQHILEGSHQYGEKGAAFRKEFFKIKKNVVCEFIKMFDFLSKIYGTYQKGKDPLILCSNDQDSLTLNSYFSTISNLFKEEQNLALQWQKNSLQMEKAFVEATAIESYSDSMSQEFQAEALSKCFSKFREFCKQEGAVVNRAYTEAIVNNVCTEESLFNLTKLNEKKKRVDQIGVIFDESQKKWDNQISDLLKQTTSSSILDDYGRKRLDFFEKTVVPRIK
ncbi:MAG: hypothetical protein ACRDFB_08275, partial [Rhabdochlamydiaceae bacterium]